MLHEKKLKREEFIKLKKQQKYELLKKEGNFVANRMHNGYQCSLFTFSGMYIEIWRPIGLNYIHWIEVLDSLVVLEEYADNL